MGRLWAQVVVRPGGEFWGGVSGVARQSPIRSPSRRGPSPARQQSPWGIDPFWHPRVHTAGARQHRGSQQLRRTAAAFKEKKMFLFLRWLFPASAPRMRLRSRHPLASEREWFGGGRTDRQLVSHWCPHGDGRPAATAAITLKRASDCCRPPRPRWPPSTEGPGKKQQTGPEWPGPM